MSTANYPINPTRAKSFLLNKKGKKVAQTDAIRGMMGAKKAEDLIEDDRSPLQKKLDLMYEMQKEISNIPQGSIQDYEVKPGDTISDVLEETGMSMAQFMALNEDPSLMSSEGELYAGDTIKIVDNIKEDETLRDLL
tara:strand:- start:5560 stop:5970 length:411 start_codon:yes stop_codon:yes gene_type:complete